jgi:RNA polymerase sigma-70 factor (ECF subfamily)
MLEGETDGALVRRIAAAGPTARAEEAELCRRFVPRARLFGLRHLRDDDRARDLAQTVMLAVLQAVREGRIAEPDRIDRFVLGACRNQVLRAMETDARIEFTADPGMEVAVDTMAEEQIDTGALVRCLDALEVRRRTVVYLSFSEGRSAAEIATTIGTTPGNVRVLRHRAVEQLRECLGAGGEERR